MKLQPIVYTTDTSVAADWYGRVLGSEPTYQSDIWTSFGVGDATLGLHRVDEVPPEGRLALSLVADEPLETVADRLQAEGVAIERGIQDEAFGRSLVVRDPDGTPVQINEHHH